MNWQPRFPETFEFYGLGQVQRVDPTPAHPLEREAIRTALGFQVLSDGESSHRSWILFSCEQEQGSEQEELQMELSNVLASRISGSWISPPLRVDASNLYRMLQGASELHPFRYELQTSTGPVPLRGWVLSTLQGGTGNA